MNNSRQAKWLMRIALLPIVILLVACAESASAEIPNSPAGHIKITLMRKDKDATP
jgi:hypothetical protein